nr:classical arabinogalactan protein 9-like [Aegilops tauschii subsp. strangulata]
MLDWFASPAAIIDPARLYFDPGATSQPSSDLAAARAEAALTGQPPSAHRPARRLRRPSTPYPRVQRSPPPIEQRAAAASPHRAAVLPPCGSPRGCTDPRRRCVAPSGRSAAAHGPRRRPEAVPVVAPPRVLPLRCPFGP